MSNYYYLQHIHNEILIPQHISSICLFSIQPMLINSIIVYQYNFKTLSFLTFCIYISSIIFWSKVKHTGIEKTLDIICVISGGAYGTYISFSLPKFYNLFWLYTLFICLTVFAINELLFYYQVRVHYNYFIYTNSRKTAKYNCFSLKYTNPNTHEREMAYYRNTIIHGLFFHIIPSISSIYCITHGSQS